MLADRSGWAQAGILLGNGSDDLILLLLAACGGEGATLLVPTPTFSMYRHIATCLGWRVEEVPLTADFALDEPALLDARRRVPAAPERLRLPEQPDRQPASTGASWSAISGPLPGLVVIDEAYHDFAGASVVGLLAGTPQPRRSADALEDRSRRAAAGGPARRPAGGRGAQQGAPAVQRRQLLPDRGADGAREPRRSSKVRSARSSRSVRASRPPWRGCPGSPFFPATPISSCCAPERPSREVFEALRRRGVLVRDLGGNPGLLHGCLRVTVGVPAENDAFLEALAGLRRRDMRPESCVESSLRLRAPPALRAESLFV